MNEGTIIIITVHLRLGNPAIIAPHTISKPPILRRYHFDGTLNSKKLDSGKALAYFT